MKHDTDAGFFSGFYASRRTFIKLSALGAMAAAGTPAMARHLARFDGLAPHGAGNRLPGRIVFCHDPALGGHEPVIDRDQVEATIHNGVRLLTQLDDTGEAFASLFPGLHAASTIAIKVNTLGPTYTRPEVVRGVVSGLSLMLGGSYDVSHVIVFDNHDITRFAYAQEDFCFGSACPTLTGDNDAVGSGEFPYGQYELSRTLLDCDYLINIPVLKSHNNALNQISVALKNHYGSCTPSSLCGDIPGMLALNNHASIKDRTCLVVTDCLRGTFTGGPNALPQRWDLYPEQTPNTLLVSTDPVTNDYWARDTINAQRTAASYAEKPCPWIEEAAAAPFELGVGDPSQMTLVTADPVIPGDDPDPPPPAPRHLALSPNTPNPFRDGTTLHFQLAIAGEAAIQIVDLRGRVVRRVAHGSYAAEPSTVPWDGKDDAGRKVPTGVYVVRLQTGSQVRRRLLTVMR